MMRFKNAPLLFLCLGWAIQNPLFSQENWWMEEPIRLVQTNLRETDSDLDAAALAQQIEDFPANTVLFGMGGIRAHYQTDLEDHIKSETLPADRDLVAEMIREVHKRNMRFIGRFDFSRIDEPVYQKHPDWFILKPDGTPLKDHNGLHNTCINGGYYRDYIFQILTEALTNYELDGVFFNWFGNHKFTYSGDHVGVCQCDGCKKRYRERYGQELPLDYTEQYDRFMYDCSREVAGQISQLVGSLRPGCMMVTYMTEHVDATSSESDTYIWHSLPLWHYSASDNVNRVRNTDPRKMALNYVMPYVAMDWRYASTSPAGIQRRLYQAMAHGGCPAFVVLGTYDTQLDQTAVNAARPVFQWHKEHEDLYISQQNQGRVALIADPRNTESLSYRGFYRLLSELHIPFIVSEKAGEILADPLRFDLVIIPENAVYPELAGYINKGGKVLMAGTTRPAIELPPTVKLWEDAGNSYLHLEDHTLFPSLNQTEVLFLYQDFLELEAVDQPVVTLIPPSSFSPPEKVSRLTGRTLTPGLLLRDMGKGEAAYLPWDVGSLYYKYSNENHRLFMSDLIDHLLRGERQLITDAHPLVEMTLTRQAGKEQVLLHLVNLSGHTSTAFFPPIEMEDIKVQIKGAYTRAHSNVLNESLEISHSGGYTRFTVPGLGAYDVITLE
ncbi:MAG: family 10 glycosylhydrolase [Bacteroidota bacterium]